MTEKEFKRLLEGYKQQRLTAEELQQFLEHARLPEFEPLLGQELLADLHHNTADDLAATDRSRRVWEQLNTMLQENREATIHALPRRKPPYRWVAAASVAVLLLAGAYLWRHTGRDAGKPVTGQVLSPADIPPGHEGAVLTLGDGRKVALDSLGDQMLAQQQGVRVLLQGGSLAYAEHDAGQPAGKTYNTVTTPRGLRFSITLPDGTRAWLNAASTIRFPVSFRGAGERMVEVSGEVYFEVAHDRQHPFKVIADGMSEIEVLGTHFNVNAYTDEKFIRTTLLEGSVKVQSKSTVNILKPGQQSSLSKTDGDTKINTVDTLQAVAWRKNLFNFEQADLETVMRQLSRWYDIDVVYENGVKPVRFGGKMKMGAKLSEVLRVLEAAGVRFRLEEGRRLVVLP